MSQKKPLFPGIRTTADGSGAVAHVETLVCDGACAYPITSSTTMGQSFQVAKAKGHKNLWGEDLSFIEPESEHSSASACEGFAAAGGRVTNFTSGQGLILMKEVLYTISGKRLPAVFHIGARALTSHSLNVHCGHDDVMGVADTGWGMLFARNAQEAADLAAIARRAAEDSHTPFLNVQDGFLTTHTIETLLLPEPDLLKQFVGNPREKLTALMDPGRPLMSGVVQNQDSYMKGKVAQRYFYDNLKQSLQASMKEWSNLTGRPYDLLSLHAMEDAEIALVGMGTMMETAMAVADHLREHQNLKVGVIHLTSFRPFPGPELAHALKNVKAVGILERMDNPPAQDNPLTAEVKAALFDAMVGRDEYPSLSKLPRISSVAAGLGSRDIRPGDLVALCDALSQENPPAFATLNIDHPSNLPRTSDPDVRPPGAFSMRGHSVGGFGSVTTNKVIASILSDLFDLDVQAYPKYGSEKKGLPTTYYMTAAHNRILPHCELHDVEFLALNDVNAFNLGNPLLGLKEGGIVFIQTDKTDPKEIWASIPPVAKETFIAQKATLLALNTVEIARETSSRADLEQRMQGIVLLGVFLRAVPFVAEKGLDDEHLFAGVERSIRKYFGKRGEQVVKDNMTAVRRGYTEAIEVPSAVMVPDAVSTH